MSNILSILASTLGLLAGFSVPAVVLKHAPRGRRTQGEIRQNFTVVGRPPQAFHAISRLLFAGGGALPAQETL